MSKLNIDKPHCNCGIFGIFGSDKAALTTYYGIHSLQHRGQEAAGIVSLDKINHKTHFNIHRGSGLLTEVINDPAILREKLKGYAAIGHNRYSTAGDSKSNKNIQIKILKHYFAGMVIGMSMSGCHFHQVIKFYKPKLQVSPVIPTIGVCYNLLLIK